MTPLKVLFMRLNHQRKYRLLVTISVLFTTLIIIFGLFFRQFIYWQTSDMLLEESNRYFSQINEELTLDYLSTRKVVSQTVHILSRTAISTADTLEKRLQAVPVFQAALKEEPILSGLQVGYETGDFFIVRPLNNGYMREQFSAPPNAAFVVDNISRGEGGQRYLQRIWFTDSLTEIGRATPKVTKYDPRGRPWYKAALATDQEASTAPYLFHFVPFRGGILSFSVGMNHLQQCFFSTT
jgi:hypothetical protein